MTKKRGPLGLLARAHGSTLCFVLGAVNGIEGISHLGTAIIGGWGLYATATHDWRLITPIAENMLFGVVSLVTGHLVMKASLPPDTSNGRTEPRGESRQ